MTGFEPGPRGRQRRASRARRDPRRRRGWLARRTRSGAGALGPAREADPGRRGARGRLVRRRGDDRRRARGLGRDARSGHAPRGGRPSRLGRAVLRGWRSGAHRGARRACRAARRACAAIRPSCSSRPASRSRPGMSSPRSMRCRASATARSGCRRSTWPRSCASGLSAADLVARAGALAMANDLLPGRGGRPAGPRAVPPGAEPGPRPADRAIRLRPDAVGALCFGGRGRPSPPTRSSGLVDAARSSPPGAAPPFVTATAIVTHPQPQEPTP